jgi:FkbM family methyltransferase
MYKITNDLKEWTLNKQLFDIEFKKKCELFGINKDNVKFYSQQDEDKYIIQYLLKEKINDGTFLEIGACDGMLYSNTKTLEDYFGFKGILIEPQLSFFNKLKNNRNNGVNELYNCAVSDNDSEFIEFIGNNAEGGILNNNNTDPKKFTYLKPYKVKNKKMSDILKSSSFDYIDFMIIDVEGSELSLLKTIDFTFPIFCIIIEAHSHEKDKNIEFGRYLKKNGFTIKERQRGNEVWLNNNYFRKHLFHCDPVICYNDLDNSNKQIIKLIQKNEPFIVSRMGIGGETFKTYEYDTTNKITNSYLHPTTLTLYNAGIYYQKNDFAKLELFLKQYRKALFNSNILASFFNSSISTIQDYFSNKYYLPQIHSRSLEPFYQIQEGIKPWTHYLLGKKVLIIHPFVESFKKQIDNDFQIFYDENKRIFLKNQEFKFYKTYQTIAGNHIHDNWFQTYIMMCNDIKNIDFDIALLGCGGYGLPLCNFIKMNLNKSAIYIGGGLQLLFGVMGKRWEKNEMWKKIISENNSKFIKPSKEESCLNSNTIEGGCYW